MSGEVDRCTKALIRAIEKSDEYQNYLRCKKRLDENPVLKQRVKEYSNKNFALQTSEKTDLYEEVDRMKEEYESLRRENSANAFLEAEVSFLSMLRLVGSEITEPLDIEIPDI